MRLFTAQIARYRLAKAENIPYIDTTVKSGESTFAPSWDIVGRHKAGTLTDAGYTKIYRNLMNHSYMTQQPRWREVANMSDVCFMCYCPACTQERPVFCHRYLLVTMFERVCNHWTIPFSYAGELTPTGLIIPPLPRLDG